MSKFNVKLDAEISASVIEKIKEGGTFYLYRGWEVALIVFCSFSVGILATVLLFSFAK
jgi:hypothetical protein